MLNQILRTIRENILLLLLLVTTSPGTQLSKLNPAAPGQQPFLLLAYSKSYHRPRFARQLRHHHYLRTLDLTINASFISQHESIGTLNLSLSTNDCNFSIASGLTAAFTWTYFLRLSPGSTEVKQFITILNTARSILEYLYCSWAMPTVTKGFPGLR